jgi:hypothetical protein
MSAGLAGAGVCSMGAGFPMLQTVGPSWGAGGVRGKTGTQKDLGSRFVGQF